MSLTLVVRMSPRTVRLTTGFLQRSFSSFFFFFGGHLHLASSSSGTGCGCVSAEKPSIAFVFGVKRADGGAGENCVPSVVARGLTTRAPEAETLARGNGIRFGAIALRNSSSALG